MVTRYGFSKELGPLVYGTDQQEVFLGRDLNQARNYSEEVASKIDKEMRAIIDRAYSQAKTILEEHTDALHTVAKVLLEYEKVDGETFIKLMETPLLEGEEAAPALSAPAGEPPVLPLSLIHISPTAWRWTSARSSWTRPSRPLAATAPR